MKASPKHILVIRLSALGDVAMTVPVLRALLDQNPEVHLTVLTRPFFKPLFRDIDRLDVIEAEVNSKHKGVFGLYRLARQLNRTHKFYAIADLHNVLRTQILKPFLRCKRVVTIDKGRNEKKALTKGLNFKKLKSTHQRYADVFNALSFRVDLKQAVFPKSEALSQKILSRTGEKEGPWIGIAPFAAHEGKMYPPDQMKMVIAELSKTYKILLFGGGNDEAKRLQSWTETFENTVNLAENLSLEEQLDVISNLDVMLSMDSGNGHLAAMYGVKVITVWGVTHPFAGFAPFDQPEDYALLADREKYPKIPTSVYGNKYPEGYERAAGSIPPKAIIQKIESALAD
ncbi:glycosyltransferase family 9 protein [Gaetbulibacter aestuarii]|uniref:Glycosyltransferase family 9 protein n=1 Tax=Gaetbulibacter aestuarii TaxID=1502358 RepID=A0ABW7MVZ8_9FLAO